MAFGPLHDLFQKIYEDHFEAQDDLAERIKALGGHVENRLAKHLDHATLKEHDGHKSAKEMVEILLKDQEHLALTMKELAEYAEENGDGVTHDLCIARAELHDERAWMLRAHLD
jgi:starvation-inducible DNA-binding protein